MGVISTEKLSEVVSQMRKQHNYTQEQLSEQTGINRTMIGRIERGDYLPTIPQLEKLFEVLHFNMQDILEKNRYVVYTAFRGEHYTDEEKAGVDHLMKMMTVARQQKLLRKAMHHES